MQVTGRINLHVNGIIIRSKEGAKANLSNVERTGVASDQGVAGYMEATNIPSVEGVLIHADDTDLNSVDFVDGSVQFETDTGQTWILRNAWLSGTLELTGAGGEVPVKFEGTTIEKVS